MIEIAAIYKKYGFKNVLNGVNLRIAEGEIHGIVGKNGSGKTTLFRCLVGLENFQGNVSTGSSKNLKDLIGFLPTTPPILSKITGEEYLKLLCVARNIKTDHFQEKNAFDLPLGRYIEAYSTGMMKKLAITGILLQGNKVFILDEPFNGLDYQSNLLLIEILLKLKSLGKTVILSSHIFSMLSETCDFIHYLENGVIRETASKEDFPSMETSMKKELIGNKIDQFDLK